jgi:hypothetical protein
MQIAIFKDIEVRDKVSLNFGALRNKQCNIDQNMYKILCENHKDFGLDFGKLEYLRKSNIREYKSVLGYSFDSHTILECLGVTTSSRNYSVVIDMSTCLDFVMSMICGCSTESVRKISDYEKKSRALLSLDTDNFDIHISDFLRKHPKLDKFIMEQISSNSSSNAIMKIYSSILTTSSEIMKYLGFKLQKEYPGLILRSIGRSSIVFTTNERPKFDDLELCNITGQESCIVKVNTLGKLDKEKILEMRMII